MTKRTYFAGFLVLLALLAVLFALLAGCGGEEEEEPTATPTHTDTPVTDTPEPPVTETPEPTETNTPLPPTEEPKSPREPETLCGELLDFGDGFPVYPITAPSLYSDARFYVPDQVIITGKPREIGKIIESLRLEDKPIFMMELELDDGYVISQFDTSETGLLEREFVKAFNKEVSASTTITASQTPVAELNYVIRQPNGPDITEDPKDSDIEADPATFTSQSVVEVSFEEQWTFRGDGPGITGDPGDSGIEADPATIPSQPVVAASFERQWAFGVEHGIGLDFGTPGYDRWGRDVKILVFDASPLGTGFHTTPFPLCVSAWIADQPGYSPPGGQALMMDSHGLFVANLAHAVAPASFMHLIQILEYDGEEGEEGGSIRGDLFSLLNTLYIYLDKNPHRTSPYLGSDGEFVGNVVVNLSLGFDIDVKKIRQEEYEQELLDAIQSISSEDIKELLSLPVVSLGMLIEQYTDDGVIFVAAAGNDSNESEISPAQAPASYPEVIGVGALGLRHARSCFSNKGNVSAPGGSGGVDACQSKCANKSNCFGESDILSIITTNGHTFPYAYWAGTSFATPLVSGMVAVTLSQGNSPEDVLQMYLATDRPTLATPMPTP